MKQIDSFPTHSIKDLEYRAGRVFPYGATIIGDAVNFSIFSKEATACSLVLFHQGEYEPYVEIPFPEEFRIGDVYTMMVFGINIETMEYGYRFDGPYDPERGLLYDRTRILLDPYARSITGRSVWGREPDPADPKRMVPCQRELDVVAEIRARHADGMAYHAIMTWLNAERRDLARHGAWNAKTVRKICLAT